MKLYYSMPARERESVNQDLRAFLPKIVLALIALVLILKVMGW